MEMFWKEKELDGAFYSVNNESTMSKKEKVKVKVK